MPVEPRAPNHRSEPRGFQRSYGGNRSIAIRLDPVMFKAVYEYSVEHRCSFAEASRQLLQKGLDQCHREA